MSYFRHSFFSTAGLCVFLFLSTACSLRPADPETLKIRLNLESSSQNPANLLQSPTDLSRRIMSASASPRPSASQFDCLAVNVVGPNIPAVRTRHDEKEDEREEFRLGDMLAGSSCAYPGILSRGVSAQSESTVELIVPAGPQRLIQVAGIIEGNTNFCQSGQTLPDYLMSLPQNFNDDLDLFELGRAVIDLFSSRTVAIQNTYDNLSLADKEGKRMNCGGNGDNGPGHINVSPSSLNFGTVSSLNTLSITLTNYHNMGIYISSITSSDPKYSLNTGNCNLQSVFSNNFCTQSIDFAPSAGTSGQVINSTITITYDISGGPSGLTYTVPATGTRM